MGHWNNSEIQLKRSSLFDELWLVSFWRWGGEGFLVTVYNTAFQTLPPVCKATPFIHDFLFFCQEVAWACLSWWALENRFSQAEAADSLPAAHGSRVFWSMSGIHFFSARARSDRIVQQHGGILEEDGPNPRIFLLFQPSKWFESETKTYTDGGVHSFGDCYAAACACVTSTHSLCFIHAVKIACYLEYLLLILSLKRRVISRFCIFVYDKKGGNPFWQMRILGTPIQ